MSCKKCYEVEGVIYTLRINSPTSKTWFDAEKALTDAALIATLDAAADDPANERLCQTASASAVVVNRCFADTDGKIIEFEKLDDGESVGYTVAKGNGSGTYFAQAEYTESQIAQLVNDGDLIKSDCPCCEGGDTPAVNPTKIPYILTYPKSQSYNDGTKNAVRELYTVQQFENGGELGGSHPLVEYDANGSPYANADVVESNITNFDFNDLSGSYGGLDVRKANLELPAIYRGNPNLVVTSLRLKDVDTATTTEQKGGVLLSYNDAGGMSLDKDNLIEIMSDRGHFDLPRSEYGNNVYIEGYLDDVGGGASMDVRYEIEYINKTTGAVLTAVEPLTAYLSLPSMTPPDGSIDEQVRVNFDAMTGQWSDADGNVIDQTIVDAASKKQQLPDLATQAITADVYLNTATNTVEVSNEFGGDGSYQYSFDRGRTWQSSPVKPLGDSSYETSVMVKDGSGLQSGVLSWAGEVDPDVVNCQIDITNAENLAESHDGVGGWEVVKRASSWSDPSYYLNDEVVNRGGNAHTSAWNSGLLGYQADSGGNTSGWVEYKRLAEENPTGEIMGFAVKVLNNYQGAAGETLSTLVTITDDVTGNVLLNKPLDLSDFPNALKGNVYSGWTDHALAGGTFIGTGNPVTIRVEANTGTGDGSGHYFGLHQASLVKSADFGVPLAGSYIRRENASMIRFNAMNGQTILNSCPAQDDGCFEPSFNLTQSGNWVDGEQNLKIAYRKNGGAWVQMLDLSDKPEVAGSLYLTPYVFKECIPVAKGDEIEYSIDIEWDNPTGKWLRINQANTKTILRKN